MRELKFMAIMLTLVTIILLYVGFYAAAGDIVAIGIVIFLCACGVWCMLLRKADEGDKNPQVDVYVDQAYDGVEPLYNCFYLKIRINGRERNILITPDTYDELNAKL